MPTHVPLYIDLSGVDVNAPATLQAIATLAAAGAQLTNSAPEATRVDAPIPEEIPKPSVGTDSQSIERVAEIADFIATASPGALWLTYQIADAKATHDRSLSADALRELHPGVPSDRNLGGWVKSALTAGLNAGFGRLFHVERIGYPKRTIYHMDSGRAISLRRQLSRFADQPAKVEVASHLSGSSEPKSRAASLVGKRPTSERNAGTRTSVS